MTVDTMRVKGIYTNRIAALKAAANWYSYTIGYLPIDEGKGKDKTPVTSILDPDDISTLLGKVDYSTRTKEYTLWLYPRCPTFRYIRAGDKVQLAGKGWGIAVMPNVDQELWVCTHGIASRENVMSVRRVP